MFGRRGWAAPFSRRSGKAWRSPSYRRSRKARTRAASTASSACARAHAAPKPTHKAVGSVPGRSPRSWPPPANSGTSRTPRRTYSAPMPFGPYSLCADRLIRSTPSAATSRGICPAAWAASVCRMNAALAAEHRDFRKRLEHADLVVGGHDRDERGVRPQRASNLLQVDQAVRSHRQLRHVETVAPQGATGLQDAWMLGHAGHDVPAIAGADGAPDREVVRLGRARGEHDLLRQGADQRCDLRARRIHRLLGGPAMGVLRRVRVAEALGEVRQHRIQRARIERCGRMVIEVHRQLQRLAAELDRAERPRRAHLSSIRRRPAHPSAVGVHARSRLLIVSWLGGRSKDGFGRQRSKGGAGCLMPVPSSPHRLADRG